MKITCAVLQVDLSHIVLYTAAMTCHSISNKQKLEKVVAEIGNWEAKCEHLGVHKAVLNLMDFETLTVQ